MNSSTSHVLLVGAGKMGGALLAAWQRSGSYNQIFVLDPKAAVDMHGAALFRCVEEITIKPDCIVFAVKPQSLDEVLPAIAKKFGDMPLYISIAAGKTLGYFALALGAGSAVVRAMPNTPALVGEGISGLCANANVSDAQKECAGALLKAAGEVVWLKDEAQMDAVTALSGSGPAYVFLFMEALVNAGRQQGLPEALCKQLAIQTIAGSAKLAKVSQEPLANLRQNVTSPGGTTEAALKVLVKNNQFKNLIAEAVAAAVKRAKEMS